jgi:hypothetical protein
MKILTLEKKIFLGYQCHCVILSISGIGTQELSRGGINKLDLVKRS